MIQYKYPCFLEGEIRCQINLCINQAKVLEYKSGYIDFDTFFRDYSTTLNIIFIRLKVSMKLNVKLLELYRQSSWTYADITRIMPDINKRGCI